MAQGHLSAMKEQELDEYLPCNVKKFFFFCGNGVDMINVPFSPCPGDADALPKAVDGLCTSVKEGWLFSAVIKIHLITLVCFFS